MNYMNGLTWGRIPGLRFLAHPSEKVTFGVFSLENAAQYFGGSGGAGVPTLPAALRHADGLRTRRRMLPTAGQSTPNVLPDIISRLAFDP